MKNMKSKEKLLKERERLIEKISTVKFILRGTIRKQGNICGTPGCKCKDKKNPVLHGPYHYLSHRYNNKGQTLFLNDKKMRLSKKGVRNYKKIINLLYKLSEVNFRLVRYYYDKLENNDRR